MCNSLNGWEPIAQCPRHLFTKQAIPMVWDFAEGNPKDRVEKIATYKKPAFWAAAVGIICVGVLTVCLLSEPKGGEKPNGQGQSDHSNVDVPESYFAGEGSYAKAAKVNVKASTGLGGSKLYYVDEEKIIFGGYYGVFVFSKELDVYLALPLLFHQKQF